MKILAFFSAIFAVSFGSTLLNIKSDHRVNELVNKINQLENGTWTAHNHANYHLLEHALSKLKLGALLKKEYPMLGKTLQLSENDLGLPENFDAREKWGQMCPSISMIGDQSTCGSCWAFGAVGAIQDRTCIATKGKFNQTLSVADLLTCCGDSCGEGCFGGYPQAAWEFWVSTGLVTGGEFGQTQVCKPYQFPRCDHHVKGRYQPCGEIKPTPACEQTCQSTSNLDFSSDKHFGKRAYQVEAERIKREIFTHGPVEGAFTVYPDFLLYKTGVYQPTGGKPVGGHAIRILGWGVEDGTPYWLVANSWNEDWGDKGLFKILRGQDCCGIESEVVAGLAKVPKHQEQEEESQNQEEIPYHDFEF